MLGISIYLGDKKVSDQEAYIRKMHENGFRSIFTSLHIPEDANSNDEKQLKDLGKLASQLNMELMADISPASLEKLGINWSHAEQLLSWGLTGLRIDYGVPESTIVALSHKMKIALNASTITQEGFKRLKIAGLNTDAVEAWHNFYPRPETGLDIHEFTDKNKWLKEAGLTIMAFIPGEGELRGPLYQSLPTIESHRHISPFAAYIELQQQAHVDKVLIGDMAINDETLAQFNAYKDQEVLLHAVPHKEVDQAMLNRIAGFHKNRPDSARDCFRSVDSRKNSGFRGEEILPYHCVERSIGSITIDNKDYLRYQGEIQITKIDLPADEKVNVVGRIVSKDRPLLRWLRGDQKIQIQWIEEGAIQV